MKKIMVGRIAMEKIFTMMHLIKISIFVIPVWSHLKQHRILICQRTRPHSGLHLSLPTRSGHKSIGIIFWLRITVLGIERSLRATKLFAIFLMRMVSGAGISPLKKILLRGGSKVEKNPTADQ